MKLYHGTSSRHLERILAPDGGITPRGKRKGNWGHSVMSHKDAVYLTNAYSLHYAQSATKPGDQLAIIEVDTECMLPWLFCPDEDYLEQASRKSDQFSVIKRRPMVERTKWFRRRLMSFRDNWQASVEHLGNCCYMGRIPAHVITRVATLSPTYAFAFASDPIITLLNYWIMGPYYRALTMKLFGDKIPDGHFFHREYVERLTRDGITVRMFGERTQQVAGTGSALSAT